jgi:hypothetical protein
MQKNTVWDASLSTRASGVGCAETNQIAADLPLMVNLSRAWVMIWGCLSGIIPDHASRLGSRPARQMIVRGQVANKGFLTA